MKSWLSSKVVWLGIITTLLGVIPLITDLANQALVTPTPAALVTAVGTTLIGILTVIVRVWFTDVPVTHPLGIGKPSDKAAK